MLFPQPRGQFPRVDAINPIGCGDAMLAGLLAALCKGDSFEGALRSATALASADANSPVAGRPSLNLAKQLEPQTAVECA